MKRETKLAQPTKDVATAVWFDRLLIAALLLFVFLLGCFSMSNGDIWWHLRTGELILERGELPYHDWYTYTNGDAIWVDLHWGFQIAAAGLWGLGGAGLLILAKSVLGTVTIGVCLTISRRDWPAWHSVGIWLAPVMIYAGRYYVRPEVVTMLLISLTLAVIYHSAVRPWLIWTLPLIQLIWVNVQGLFVLQFVIIGCFLVDAAVRQVLDLSNRHGNRPPSFRWRSWIAVTVLTGLASLLNPYGVRGALFPLTLMQRLRGPEREFFHRFSGELQGFDSFVRQNGWFAVFSNLTSCLLVMVFLGCLASFVILLWYRRLSVYRFLLFMGFAYLAWQMKRNSVPFAIVTGVVLRLNLGELMDLTTAKSPEQGSPTRLQRLGPVFVATLVGLLIASVPTGIYFQVQRATVPKRFGIGEAAWYGHAAAQFLRQPGMPAYVYAQHLGQAAVCIYHLCPEKRVYADARLELNTPETLARYDDIKRQLVVDPAAAEKNLTYGIPAGSEGQPQLPALVFDNTTLIVNVNLLESLQTSGRWRCVYSDLPPLQNVWELTELLSDPTATGASVFLEDQLAEKLGLPNVLNH